MRDRTRAEAGLVGENAAGNAALHADEQTADGTARESLRVKRADKNGSQHAGQTRNVQDNHAKPQKHIQKRHKRHELFAHTADALDAAQQHHGNEHCA